MEHCSVIHYYSEATSQTNRYPVSAILLKLSRSGLG